MNVELEIERGLGHGRHTDHQSRCSQTQGPGPSTQCQHPSLALSVIRFKAMWSQYARIRHVAVMLGCIARTWHASTRHGAINTGTRPTGTTFAPSDSSEPFCDTSIDGIGTCWPRSKPRQMVSRPCPEMFYGVRYNTTSKTSSIPTAMAAALSHRAADKELKIPPFLLCSPRGAQFI